MTHRREDSRYHEVLATHGFGPGPEGYDADVMEAAIVARGWNPALHEAAPSGTDRRVRRYQAVLQRRPAAGQPPRLVMARGRSEAEALAKALATVLAGRGAGGQDGRLST